jgi:hypothetical protein
MKKLIIIVLLVCTSCLNYISEVDTVDSVFEYKKGFYELGLKKNNVYIKTCDSTFRVGDTIKISKL